VFRSLLALVIAASMASFPNASAPKSLPQDPAVMSDDPPAAGVPLTLAEERARRITALRYELDFNVPSAISEPLHGRAAIRFTLADASGPLALDFTEAKDRIAALMVNGRAPAFDAVNGHIVIPASALLRGDNEISVEFLAGDAPLNRNPEFLYTLFVPARARMAFPCFDQPDLKARWTLTLEIPAGWEALGNGAEVGRHDVNGHVRIRFAETPPLPTYLFAFAAGKFSIETATRGARTFRMFHRETDTAKVANNRDAVFDLHAAALDWLERYTGIPYPWGKFDFLLVPAFQVGGMEHAGAIFYNAPGILLDPSATQNQKLGRASVIAHETAHLWFGDLVTMRWFNDVWMKEVFANFMAAKIVNPSFPGIDHELRFLYAHYPGAYDVERTPGTNAIRQQLDNLDEAGSLYGAIIYQKAPIVMRQLEGILGEAPFRDGLRHYLRAHEFANATWPDLIAVLDEKTPEDLAAWSRAWVDEPGRPTIKTELSTDKEHITRLAFTQRDTTASRGLLWNQKLQVVVGLPSDVRTFPVHLSGREVEVPEAVGLPKPQFVLPTGGGIGYGAFEMDPESIVALLHVLPDIEDPLTRGAALVALWDQMLDGRAEPSAFLELSLRALPRERDEQNVQRLLNYAEQAYWKFLRDAARATVSARLEAVLRQGLDRAPSASLKSAWFSTLRDVARSTPVLDWLERIWRKSESVPGLVLAEPDYISLAQQLALREVPAWSEILDQQRARTVNPDRKARFEFVRPALSPDQKTRDAFFESLRDVRNRRREPWVLEALGFLHHPLRAASSEKYIPVSLEMLLEVRQTGDVFFPKRWMDATLGGHSSASAAQMVNAFLAKLPPDYPDRLRKIVLSSSDDLFRASGVRVAATH
jgi:aminopeptidase N